MQVFVPTTSNEKSSYRRYPLHRLEQLLEPSDCAHVPPVVTPIPFSLSMRRIAGCPDISSGVIDRLLNKPIISDILCHN